MKECFVVRGFSFFGGYLLIDIEVLNFSKYNPRKDVKSSSWLRLDNSFLEHPGMFDLSNDEKIVLIYLICKASKKMNDRIQINSRHCSIICNVKEDFILTILHKLINSNTIALVTPTVPDGTLRTNVTDERTDVTDEQPAREIPFDEINNLYMKVIAVPFKKPSYLTPNSKDVRNFIDTCKFIKTTEDWEKYFLKALESKFLMGPKFTLALGKLLDPIFASDLLNGKYDDSESATPSWEKEFLGESKNGI